jgi:hypothetical protein
MIFRIAAWTAILFANLWHSTRSGIYPMSDIDALPPPPPSVDQERLARLEARVAELEAKLAATEIEPDSDKVRVLKAELNFSSRDLATWLRYNPVMALVIALVGVVILFHLMS